VNLTGFTTDREWNSPDARAKFTHIGIDKIIKMITLACTYITTCNFHII